MTILKLWKCSKCRLEIHVGEGAEPSTRCVCGGEFVNISPQQPTETKNKTPRPFGVIYISRKENDVLHIRAYDDKGLCLQDVELVVSEGEYVRLNLREA
jgi:hypothetical protein